MKYFFGSTFILLLALLSIGDMFILVGSSIFILPVILLLQWLTLSISKKIKRIRKHAELISLTPATAVAVWIVFTMSIWMQPYQAFKVVFGQSMPSSVENFFYTEEAWTDYMTQFYFDVSSEDLKSILKERKFRKVGFSKKETVNLSQMEWILESLEPIIDPISYRYEIPEDSEGRGGGFCDLYTNPEHNRVYVFYAVD